MAAPTTAGGVEVDGLTVHLGRRAVLTDLDLVLGGGIVALAGPNGAGKSTLLRVLATLQRPRAGRVHLDGVSLASSAGRREARRRTGFLPQRSDVPGSLSVVDAVRHAGWLKGLAPREREAAVDEVLALLDLDGWRGHRLAELSGGTRQRAELAQTLVHRPRVLLLDEPTVGLDAEHRVEVRRWLRRIAPGRLVVMSTHVSEDIELLAERVIVLAEGRLRFDGTPRELAGRAGRAPVVDEGALESALRSFSGSRP